MISIAIMWDDGLVTDLKLMDVLRKFKVTSSFAISPARHKISRCNNDDRGDYGTLVSTTELKEFEDFEICNHGNSHLDFKKIEYDKALLEITEGKKRLEEIFKRNVDGFCYPYGTHTTAARKILKDQNIKYARTTLPGKNNDPFLLNPTAKWNEIDLDSVSLNNIILWGHTYELRTKSDWDRVINFYKKIIDNPMLKIINFDDMTNNIFDKVNKC